MAPQLTRVSLADRLRSEKEVARGESSVGGTVGSHFYCQLRDKGERQRKMVGGRKGKVEVAKVNRRVSNLFCKDPDHLIQSLVADPITPSSLHEKLSSKAEKSYRMRFSYAKKKNFIP